MQQDYNKLKEEHDEEVRAAAKYREELHHKNEELNVVLRCWQTAGTPCCPWRRIRNTLAWRGTRLGPTSNRKRPLSKRRIGSSRLLLGNRTH